ncbi:hypothetical protein HanXRQr2_Chr12g0524011 [Helianthus annuus]|uniref:Uncharacterized protein n=1 Tax=Helianthus annuus TaxID=4232 RepID=A0A251SZC6_HELAN|nr:hypothetical protein HanXRQr2_Chr12g0524011 [Helianthus annuus]KAJ0861281.1 hypothetical protein HanPSC8_Chr12g0504901 [Helianthus annuus]
MLSTRKLEEKIQESLERTDVLVKQEEIQETPRILFLAFCPATCLICTLLVFNYIYFLVLYSSCR